MDRAWLFTFTLTRRSVWLSPPPLSLHMVAGSHRPLLLASTSKPCLSCLDKAPPPEVPSSATGITVDRFLLPACRCARAAVTERAYGI